MCSDAEGRAVKRIREPRLNMRLNLSVIELLSMNDQQMAKLVTDTALGLVALELYRLRVRMDELLHAQNTLERTR